MSTIQSKIHEAICEAALSVIDTVSGAELETAAYKPTKPYTGSLPSGTVKKGSKGTNVKHVQKFLNWAIKAGLSVDGVCGKKTVAAIKRFQKAQKIKVDGVFGTQSRRAAQALIKKYASTPTSTPTPAPATTAKTGAEKIVEKANEFAWAYGTDPDKYSYSKGNPKAAYKTALKKYMGKKARVSQSDCGYFVSTCVMAAGLAKAKEFNCLKFQKPPSTMKIALSGKSIPDGFLKPGDVIRYKKKSGQHTMIYMGNGRIAEAQRPSEDKGLNFPAIKKDTKKYNKSNVKKSTLQVLRAK